LTEKSVDESAQTDIADFLTVQELESQWSSRKSF